MTDSPDKLPADPRPRLARVWRSVRREPLWPQDERGQARLALNDLILHLHPPRTQRRALRFTYTFGLGGLAILLLLIQVGTGVLLMFAYTPSPAEAYRSLVMLETEVAFGQLIRNLHHWSANLLLIVAVLHLLRVFYTAAFRPPREFNWQLGLSLLGLVALANFTGYLLPWDQLSYWAVTVAMSLLGYVPLIGEPLRRLLLGGPEVGAATLTNFYALHVILIPLGLALTGSFHIWRVRKDKFSTPRRVGEPPPPNNDSVTTIPHLVGREFVFALVVLALLLTWAAAVDAPLLAAADPARPPNPTKAAWYFVGVQELLLHFHPLVGAVFVPALTVSALIALPYLRDDQDTTGVWFRSWRGRGLALLSFALGALVTAFIVWADETWLDLPALLPFLSSFLRDGLLPFGVAAFGVWRYARLLRGPVGATRGETRLAIFTLLLAAFIALTVIGNLFRGEDMAFVIPWDASMLEGGS